MATNNTKFDSSIATMKASFKAIADAKTHAVLLDTPASRNVFAGTTKKIIIKNPAKTTIETTTKPTTITTATAPRPEIIPTATKKKMKPKSKLAKLVKGRTVFDFSK